MQDNKYSLYHLIGYNNVSLRTIQKLVDDDGLTVHDFLLNTTKVHSILGNRKSVIEKINTAIKMVSVEQFKQPCLFHLSITGLSQHNILFLQSLNITYSELKDFTLENFFSKSSISRASTYKRIMKAYNEFQKLLPPTPNNKEEIIVDSVDSEYLIKEYIDTLNPGTFFTVKQLLEEIPGLTSDDFQDFSKKNLLVSKGLWYRKKYGELKTYLNENSGVRNRDVLIRRIQNETLQEISEDLNVTRQAISLRQKAALKSIPLTEEELLYSCFFENFICSKDLFCKLFSVDDQIFNFLTMRLQKGTKNILDNLTEYPFTNHQKKIILNNFNGFINHKNELKSLNKNVVFEDVIFYYGKNSTNDSEIFLKFNEHILKNNYDLDLFEDSGPLRGLSERCQYALRDRGNNYRYYDFEKLNEEEIVKLKELLNLSPGIYSMRKIFNDYINFMKSIDIRNENELHNLYKSFIEIPNVFYNRMPEFAIGNIEKNEFLIHLFHEQSPIQIDDFVSYVNENYGLKKTSLKSHIQMFLSEYVSNEIIRVNYEELSDEESSYLKTLLTEEIHTVDEISKLGNQKFSNFHDKFINNMLLKQLGYTIRGEFILSNSYGRVERFFIQNILENEYFVNERLPINRTQIFWKVIYDLEKNLDLLKVEKDMYITASKLEKSGVPKTLIMDFQNKVMEFASDLQYFSIPLLRKKGFTHKLFDLGFESIFYDRILWADTRIKTITLSAGYLFIVQHEDVSLVNFLEWLLYEFEIIDGFDLMDYIKDLYHVQIDFQRAVTLLQRKNIYYSSELNKFYCDKNTFFEEIYK